MKIVADIDLPYLDEMFAGRAEVVRLKASAFTAGAVRDADAIVVRSVTKVNPDLLAGSRVSFAGTATIGTDHVDAEWLASRGIAFASAPGCNANAVSEYVTAALLELSTRFAFRLRGATLGVVGVGNVGSRVAAKAASLGMTVVLNDPPLARATGSAVYRPIGELMACDIVTLHVPLTVSGPDATWHFFDAGRIGAMKPGSFLINTARGAAVDGPALAGALRAGHLRGAVIDVWEGEPSVDPSLVSLAAVATAHIAGYSNDAKARASEMMYDAVCAHFGWERTWRLGDRLPKPAVPVIDPAVSHEAPVDGKDRPGVHGDPEGIVRRVVGTAYPILRDDAALRLAAGLAPGEKEARFIRLRNEYPVRREFPATAVRRGTLPGFPEGELSGLGFRIVP